MPGGTALYRPLRANAWQKVMSIVVDLIMRAAPERVGDFVPPIGYRPPAGGSWILPVDVLRKLDVRKHVTGCSRLQELDKTISDIVPRRTGFWQRKT